MPSNEARIQYMFLYTNEDYFGDLVSFPIKLSPSQSSLDPLQKSSPSIQYLSGLKRSFQYFKS